MDDLSGQQCGLDVIVVLGSGGLCGLQQSQLIQIVRFFCGFYTERSRSISFKEKHRKNKVFRYGLHLLFCLNQKSQDKMVLLPAMLSHF